MAELLALREKVAFLTEELHKKDCQLKQKTRELQIAKQTTKQLSGLCRNCMQPLTKPLSLPIAKVTSKDGLQAPNYS